MRNTSKEKKVILTFGTLSGMILRVENIEKAIPRLLNPKSFEFRSFFFFGGGGYNFAQFFVLRVYHGIVHRVARHFFLFFFPPKISIGEWYGIELVK